MEEQKTIKDYIVDYLLDGEDEKRLDPVLVEWLAEDESHRKEFNLGDYIQLCTIYIKQKPDND